jgi:PAT family acetyl-CoA transporter-like MFS transporter 1
MFLQRKIYKAKLIIDRLYFPMLIKDEILTWRILLITILYILQGVIQGLKTAIPLFLVSYKASWQQQATFSWVAYPFSLKILWAPIVDSIYNRRIGRQLTWLIPIQIIIGIILIILSIYLETLLIDLEIVPLTIIFFLIYMLIATQDIVVDGWSIILFAGSNLQWSSTCQTIGQVIGHFIGSTVLMTLESSNFTNKYIRRPLSLPQYSSGLFSLEQFLFFWGLAFIIITIMIAIIFFYKKQLNNNHHIYKQKKIQTKLNLFETYFAIFKLFKKQCMQEFFLILLTFGIGFVATHCMTILTLLEYGITRDTIALMNIPIVLIHILVPLYMSNIQDPLMWFARGYIPRLIGCVILAIYILIIPQIIHTRYFYPILLGLLCLNEILVFVMVVSRIGFCARISEPHIAGTYMTLLATISNLGHSILSTLVFYTANWLPKSHAYTIEVGGCFLLGLIWIGLFWDTIKRLDTLPVDEWYLKPYIDLDITTDYEPLVKYN